MVKIKGNLGISERRNGILGGDEFQKAGFLMILYAQSQPKWVCGPQSMSHIFGVSFWVLITVSWLIQQIMLAFWVSAPFQRPKLALESPL